MGSSIGPARQVLFTNLDNTISSTGPQVTFGPPAIAEEQEVVALLGVLNPTETPAALGQRRVEETYHLEVGIKVHNPAGDPAEVDQRGFELRQQVRAVIEADLTLSGTVRTALIVSDTTDGVLPADPTMGGGYVIFFRLLVECAQRIT